MCDDCNNHVDKVKEYLELLNIEYEVDPGIVRGLDYYTRTIFEIINDDFTAIGGGRYNKMIEELGGPDMPAVGFAMGMERTIMTLEKEGIEIPKEERCTLYIGSRGGENEYKKSFTLANDLRQMGISVEIYHMSRSVKADMKFANKLGAKFTTIIGEDEVNSNVIKLKRMSDGESFEVSLNDLDKVAEVLK